MLRPFFNPYIHLNARTYTKLIFKLTEKKIKHLHVDNIKMYLQETGYKSMDYTVLTQDMIHRQQLVNTAINLQVP
jgi:hypothetical protein